MARTKCLHVLFGARARLHPDRVAICAADQQLTYSMLEAHSDRLAQRLTAAGVGRETLVGLCVDRTPDLIVGLLAILKAGGAYVAIDPDYPPARMRLLLEDSGIRLVLTVSRVAERLIDTAIRVLAIDGEVTEPTMPAAPTRVSSTNLAYVCYTSGSTGRPKGVMVEHRHVVRLFDQTRQWFAFEAADVWTMAHSISFDFSVWEIWGALLHGGRLVIVPTDVVRSPERLMRLVDTHGVTVLNLTPSAFRQIVAAERRASTAGLQTLRVVIFGGEALDVTMLAPWIARHGDEHPMLVNMYGITETTVHVTYRRILADDVARAGVSPIGVPIPDLQVHVLDDAGQPVGVGVAGELYVAGAGVARGYLANPDQSAQRFVRRAAVGRGRTRLYRSGDRVLRLPNGELAYLGRVDDQLKVRGFRVEPREVEACLCAHPGVLAAAVVSHDYGDGDVRLAAYVVPARSSDLCGAGPDTLATELAALAAAHLPAAMRPSIVQVLPQLPLTPHGKLDRAALQQSVDSITQGSRRHEDGALTATEEAIVRIAEDVLQRTGVSLHDDLFDLGATSLTIVRLVSRINDRFQVSFDGSELADDPTLACLARSIDADRARAVART